MKRLLGALMHSFWIIAVSIAFWAAAATDVLAHHPMGGKTPSTFMEGFLSGIGHPVIGPDHLAFIVAIGIAAALLRGGLGLIAAFIAASTSGVLLHASALDIPLSEQLVAASVVAAGALLALGLGSRPSLWQPLVVVAGVFHGYAFGETIVGAERGVVGSYLIGLAIIEAFIAIGLMQFTAKVLGMTDAAESRFRTAGILVTAIGVVVLTSRLVTV